MRRTFIAVAAIAFFATAQTMVDYSTQIKNAPASSSGTAGVAVVSPLPTLITSSPLALQSDGSWLLANAPLPPSGFGGAAFNGGAFIVVHNGAIAFGDAKPAFQVIIQGFDVRIVPACGNTGQPCPLWQPGDDVRVVWAQHLL